MTTSPLKQGHKMKFNIALILSLLVGIPMMAAQNAVDASTIEQVEPTTITTENPSVDEVQPSAAVQTAQEASPANVQATKQLSRAIMMGNFEHTKKALADGADVQATFTNDLTSEDMATLLVMEEINKIPNTGKTYATDKVASAITGLSALTWLGSTTTMLGALIHGYWTGSGYATFKKAGWISVGALSLVTIITAARQLYWREPRERLKILCLLSAYEPGQPANAAAQAVEKKVTLGETRDYYTNQSQMLKAQKVIEMYEDEQA